MPAEGRENPLLKKGNSDAFFREKYLTKNNTSDLYREELQNCGIIQSMNSDGGRCHDNARCEAMWARMKEELLYGRYDTKQMTMEELKTLIWRYYMIYWNTRRICSANGGLPPMVKRKQYYDILGQVA